MNLKFSLFNVLCSITSGMLFLPMLIQAGWYNWAGNIYFNPTIIERPTTKEALIKSVKQAEHNNHKICIVGAGHSFSEIACTHDYCISMQHLNTILSVNTTLMQVRAEGGILINAFNEQIAQHGLALPNLPAMGGMTLAGALCTATHGTGNTATLSSFIINLELITADGIVHNLSAASNPEEFKAACVSLGSLGVIYSITMQCEPLFILEYHQKLMSIHEVLEQYKQLFEQSDYFQCRWQLQDNLVYADFWDRVSPEDDSATYAQNKVMSYKALQWDTNTEPGMASEIAVPIDVFPQAVFIIKDLAHLWAQQGLIIPEVVCRFVRADKNTLLSPAAYGDVAYLNIGTESDAQYYDFFKDFETALYPLQGRPHWGKVNFLNYESAYSLYGENLLKFIHVKHKFDPNNVFSNAYSNRILGLFELLI